MTTKPNIDPTDPRAAQVVDALAGALSHFENACMSAMALHEEVRARCADFQQAIDTHQTYIPYGGVAQAAGRVGEAFALISAAHRELDKLRRAKGYPEPQATTRNGGGGGKP